MDMKDNQLIAEFMGMTYGDPNDNSVMIQMTPQGNEVVPIESMKYHTSWDWLMPVVQKCRLESRCEYDEDDNWNEIHWSLEECNLDKTYKAVVQFINEFNKN